jgi:putative FmdB family regulatory protein
LPIYEYKCEGCGETFEVIQKFADEPLAVHEKCGGHVHRLMSAPSFQLKGTGWYATDYAKGGTSAPPKQENKGESSSDSKSETKSESKTETKSETKTEAKPASTEKAS